MIDADATLFDRDDEQTMSHSRTPDRNIYISCSMQHTQWSVMPAEP
jgi:hypothetical protein